MASAPPPPANDDISVEAWIAVGLGGATVFTLFVGVLYMGWRRYKRYVSMQSNNMRSVNLPPSEGRGDNGFRPSQLFSPAPGECQVGMPLLGIAAGVTGPRKV